MSNEQLNTAQEGLPTPTPNITPPPTAVSAEPSTTATAMMTTIFGDDFENMSTADRAHAIDKAIEDNIQKGRLCDTRLAIALYIAKRDKLYEEAGFKYWNEFAQTMATAHGGFGSLKQADRYAKAIEIFVERCGQPIATIEKYGPSALGFIAMSGVVQTRKDADYWLQFLEIDASMKHLEQEIKRQKALVIEGDTTPLTTANNNAQNSANPTASAATGLANENKDSNDEENNESSEEQKEGNPNDTEPKGQHLVVRCYEDDKAPSSQRYRTVITIDDDPMGSYYSANASIYQPTSIREASEVSRIKAQNQTDVELQEAFAEEE